MRSPRDSVAGMSAVGPAMAGRFVLETVPQKDEFDLHGSPISTVLLRIRAFEAAPKSRRCRLCQRHPGFEVLCPHDPACRPASLSACSSSRLQFIPVDIDSGTCFAEAWKS